MTNHQFLLILRVISDITPELSDKLYEATGGDIEFNMRDGVTFLEFAPTAPSLQDAVTSAIDQVERGGAGIQVVRVEN